MTALDQQQQRRFTELLSQSQRQLFGYLFAILRNLEETQEVYQETCVVLWEKFHQFEGRSSFATWACQVGRSKAIDYLRASERQRARFSEALDEQLAALAASLPSERIDDRREALETCIEKLRPQDRALVRAVYGEGEKVRDLAARLNRPVEGVHGTLRRVRTALFECIDRALAQEGRP